MDKPIFRRDLGGRVKDVRVGNVTIDEGSGIVLVNPANGQRTVHLQLDGDAFFGDDITRPSHSSFIIFSQAQDYNGEQMGAGDVLFGDNTASKANMLWDRSTGKILMRSGTTTQAYIDVTGVVTAGNGAVLIDANGITLQGYLHTENVIYFKVGAAIRSTITYTEGSGIDALYLGSNTHIDGNATIVGSATADHLRISDGITAPGTTPGQAKIYVDTADGSLKVKFASGTIKTLATDP